MITVVISYVALPEHAEPAQRAISDLVATVLSREPSCGGIEILRGIDDPARFTLVERWASREAFLGPHMQQPHIQSFIQGAGAFLAGPPDISFWQAATAA